MRDRFGHERGQTLPLVVCFLLVLLLMCGCVVDFGNAYRVRAQLQASTDAAATAAADQLPDPSLAIATAHAYSGEPGGRNAIPGTQDVQLNVSANCNTSPKFCSPANTITVDQSADVKTYFLGLIGIDTIPVKVHAQACSPCATTPLDVMIVLDRTGSMAGQKIQNAEKGVEAFLGTMDPQADNVGLAILPPAKDSASVCSAPQSSNYNDINAPYVVVPLSSDYETSTGALDPSSRLVSTLRCVQAGGQTAYANALDAAKAELDAHGRAGVQKVIVILSDGAANTGPTYLAASSPYRTQPCQTAVNIADQQKSDGVLLYSVAYDLGGVGAQDCGKQGGGNESPPILANEALQEIASPGNYYAEPQPSSLTGIFLAISADLGHGTSRLNG
jgi:Flp pilus assembly protein TadG